MSNDIGAIKVSPEQVAEICLNIMPTGTPVIVIGPPGVAKSYTGMQLPKMFEKRLGVPFDMRVLNLSQHEPTDIGGIPYVKDGRMHMAVSELWPTEPNCVMVIEEFTKGPKLSQNALGEVMLEKRVGKYNLPENVFFYLSCNRRGDMAGDEKILSHLANRACILYMGVDPDGFCSHAIRSGFHPHLIAFLNQFKHLVFDEKSFNSEHGKYNPEKPSFASPRSWEKVSRLLSCNLPNTLKMPAIAGLVGQGPMTEFIAWEEIMQDMPDINVCINSPKSAPLPKEMSVMYALSVSLAYATKKDTVKNIVDYVKRMRKEYQVLWAKSVAERDPVFVASNKEIREWISDVADIFWSK